MAEDIRIMNEIEKMFISPLIREMQFKSIMRCTRIRIAKYKD